ncbi:MAG TPA: peptide MFS transporter [Vicinamibacterales bacterium]|jgi:POT family proton-dependent oligopeptide transporter|nr:peptide MFS transporter [Vicinamibacterales bacterium]
MPDPSSAVALDSPLGASSAAAEHDRAFFGHPRGLSTLFFTEMWERFSYYGMRALLLLYMTAPLTAGGLGFDAARGGAIYGLYTSMVYMTSLPGGWIADRLIGQRRAVLYGGIFIASGHFSMAIPSISTFYLGLFLIVIGTGLLKGNVSVIVGQLYGPTDTRRDAGFSIFYMGINLGAFIAPLVCGYLGQRIDWHVGFAAAGIGMVFGLIQYTMGSKYLGKAGLEPAPAESPAAAAALRQRATLWGGIAVAAIVAAAAAIYAGVLPVTASQIADGAGYFLLIICVAFFGRLFFASEWTPAERKRLYVIGVLFLASALFWAAFEQAGSTLNLFADRSTRNEVLGISYPSSWFQSLNSLFLIIFAPVFAWVWIRMGKNDPSSPAKFAGGLILVGAGFAVLIVAAQLAQQGVQVSPMWLTVTYFLHTCGELMLSPVGLSAMTKLAPVRIAGLMMGVWFLATSVGNYIGGRLASFYESWPLPNLFGAVAAFAIVAGLILLAFVKPIGRMIEERK